MQPYADESRAQQAQQASRLTGIARAVALVLFALWVARYMHEPEPLLHGSLLIFHEAGHVVFMPFGEFVMVLGGSLFQLMVPGFFVGYFLHRRDPFAAAFALLYLAASIDGVARYIGDARAGDLPLLGDRSTHDWTFLLIEMKQLENDTAIARVVRLFGFVTYAAGIWLGAGWLLEQRGTGRAADS